MKRPWKRIPRLLGISAAALAILGGAALHWGGKHRVTVRIVSDPPGASVYAGNEYVGVAPLSVSVAPGERKELRLVKREHLDGRLSLAWDDYLPDGFARRIGHSFRAVVYEENVSLRPMAASSLVLTSLPEGATVFVDAQRAGTTPFDRGGMRPGSYTIRLEHPDCFPLAFSLELPPGRETRHHETLRNRVVKFYKELIAREPLDMVHRSGLVHYHVLRGEFDLAVEAARDAVDAVNREGRAANLGRFTAEIQHIYARYYTYPEETESNKIRPALREIMEDAVKEEGNVARHWRNCIQQMDRYDQARGQ